MFKASVITISDKGFRGEREDTAGPLAAGMLKEAGYAVIAQTIVPDEQTLEAIVANRYELMAGYAREVRRACASEVTRLKANGQEAAAAQLKRVRRWVHRDEAQMPVGMAQEVQQACANLPQLDKLIAMREELRALWTRTNVSAEQLVHDLQEWCHRAESSGIAALQEFSRKLRAAHA